MNKKKLQNTLLLFSLFLVLVLPTAIVGYGNLSTLVNKAFGKPFQQEESTFIVGTESSANISKGSQFSVKTTVSAPTSIPLKHFAAFVEYDSVNIDIRSINLQNEKDFSVVEFNNGFLVYPSSMETPGEFAELMPQTCFDADTCNMTSLSTPSVTFSINGILINELTEQQRPIKISLIGASEAESVFLWNEKTVLPSLKLGEYIKNTAPTFTSEPTIYANKGTTYTYQISTTDEDEDPVVLSLKCPEDVFCDKKQSNPASITLSGNTLSWDNPEPRDEPYKITIFANDGKSISTQSFLLYVYPEDTAYFSCTYTPAIAVKIIDYREVTPLVIIAESSEPLVSAEATLERDGTIEKRFNYTFEEGTKKVLIDSNSTPPLEYQFQKGEYIGEAIFTGKSGRHYTCELDNPTERLTDLIKKSVRMTVADLLPPVSALVADYNNKPYFTTDPYLPPSSGGSSPSVSFVYGTPYEFTLTAKDSDGDVLSHKIVAKPDWAKVTVTQNNGTPSSISVQFTGTPTETDAGSNLFAVTINDGYGKFITKTWVINVDYPNNDIPRLYLTRTTQFTLPSYCPAKTETPVTLHQGEGFMLVFDVEDRHQIVKFGLYYAKSLNPSSWKTYNSNISYKMRCMEVNTANIPTGDYYFRLTATDGFNPAATGSIYTNLVRILPPAPKPTATPKPTSTPNPTSTTTPTGTTAPTGTVAPTATPTPTATEEPPQAKEIVINITSPQDQKDILAEDFQIVASIKASEDGQVESKNVKVILSGTDITDKIEFSTEKAESLTLTYKPSALIDVGVHTLKITASDTKEKTAEKEITFIIKEETVDNKETVSFLGFELEKKWYAILIAVIILVGILVLLPIILYFASRNDDKFVPAAKPTYKPNNPPTPPNLNSPTSSFARPVGTQPRPPVVGSDAMTQRQPVAPQQRPSTMQSTYNPITSGATSTPTSAPVMKPAQSVTKPAATPAPKSAPVPTTTPSTPKPNVAPTTSKPQTSNPKPATNSQNTPENAQQKAMANFVQQAKQSPSIPGLTSSTNNDNAEKKPKKTKKNKGNPNISTPKTEMSKPISKKPESIPNSTNKPNTNVPASSPSIPK